MLHGATIAVMNLSIAPLDIWLGGLRIIRAESHLMAGLSRWPQYRKEDIILGRKLSGRWRKL
jgi:hypothetical protein